MEFRIDTALGSEIARYLDLSASEAKLTAANMANIDTPGYRAVGMDFASEMRSAIADVSAGRRPQTIHVTEIDGLIARPDGNDVRIDREGLNLAEAQLKFKTGVALLRQEYQRILDAIHADSK